MAQVVALDGLLAQRRVWKGHAHASTAIAPQPTGWPELDAALPTAGWPEAALSELLLPADGVGELQLLWPALARLSQRKEAVIALVCPPYRPYPPAWHAAGVRLSALQVIEASSPREALWATEQCLRSGACSAVLGWPRGADDRALRRLQVAAETGQALGFAFRSMKAAANPSPASLRLLFEAPGQLRVLKCRGGLAPAQAIRLASWHSATPAMHRDAAVDTAVAPRVPATSRPSLHDVLHGGLRPIAMAAAVPPEETNAPRTIAPRRRPALAPVFAVASSNDDAARSAAVPCPASPGSAASIPQGIAPTTTQA